MEALDAWLARQYPHAATAMLSSVSPCGIIKTRAGFNQTIRPIAGSIVASPIRGAYDPDPDYFFHWYRDSAVVIDAMRVLYAEPSLRRKLQAHVADFVGFSLALQNLDGRAITADAARRDHIAPEFMQHLRPDPELDAVRGEQVASDTRVNPDGSLDILKWARPQHDGPALRALAMLRWLRAATFTPDEATDIARLIRADLGYVLRHALDASFDIWEEELGQHYYTLCVSAAALENGASWLDEHGDRPMAGQCGAQAQEIFSQLDGYWLEREGFYRSRAPRPDGNPAKALDIAVILAAVHGAGTGPRHSVHDGRMRATLARLDELFDAAYAINRGRPADRGAALGRYAGDRYYSGGAYYFSTLGAAEFCYRAGLPERGDAYLRTVQFYTPPNGDMSEQFDQNTGQPASARQLAWSYAAFITCVAARRALNPPAAA